MTNKIKVYNSLFDESPSEIIEASGTIGEYLSKKYAAYKPDEQPFVLQIDGIKIDSSDWGRAKIEGDVRLYYSAQGGGLQNLLEPTGAIKSIFKWIMPSVKTPKNKTSRDQQQLSPLDISANTAKLGDVLPDIAGRFKRFPDYLLPPHRYFVDETTQVVEMLLCVGKGDYSIPDDLIKIGDTPVTSLGSDVTYTIYSPDDDVSGDTASVWWHESKEVGGTSLGSAGLQLLAPFTVEPNPFASAYCFDNFDITIPTGAGEYPTGWASGMVVKITNPRDYTVLSGARSIIQIAAPNDFTELLPFVGMVIEIVGDNAGYYKIHSYQPYVASPLQLAEITLSYDDGSPVTSFTLGAQSMSIGYRGLLYEITAASSTSISVDRLTDLSVVESGWNGFDTRESTQATLVLDGSSIQGGWVGPFTACPKGYETDTVEIDLFYPSGLGVDGHGVGTINSFTEIQWRDSVTAGAWSSLYITKTGATLDQIGFTETILFGGNLSPEFRLRRTGAVQTDTRYHDTSLWYGLRAKLTSPTSYAGVTTIALSIKSGDRISAQTENKINLECTRILPTLSGGTWGAPVATRNIADYFAYVAKDLGYVDAQIDIDELDRLNDIWNSRSDCYDWQHESSNARDILNQVLQAGFAELTVSSGKLKPVRDEIRTTFEQMYTPQNMTAPLVRKFNAKQQDDKDGVDITYVDENTWTNETVECRLVGDAGLRVQKITLDGVTNRDKAWRIGMRYRRALKYSRWAYDWETELDGLCSNYLSYCAVGDDVPGYGKSCIVESAIQESGGVMLTVSEPITISGSSIVSLRLEDGLLDGPYTATQGASEFEVFAQGLYTLPVFDESQEPPHALIGTLEKWSFPVLVKSIQPSGNNVSLTAINYSVDVYADDDNFAP